MSTTVVILKYCLLSYPYKISSMNHDLQLKKETYNSR